MLVAYKWCSTLLLVSQLVVRHLLVHLADVELGLFFTARTFDDFHERVTTICLHDFVTAFEAHEVAAWQLDRTFTLEVEFHVASDAEVGCIHF